MSDIKILKAGQSVENKLNVVYIYMLVDPLTNLVRYIGKSNNIDVRFKEHIRKSKYSNTLKIKQSSISNVCNKENRTYYNYKWVKIN